MAKPSRDNIISTILNELEIGITRSACLTKYVKEWQMSDRTFDRYWKTANEQHRKRQQEASQAADAAYIETKVEAVKEAVMSKQERLALLTRIAKGDVRIPKDEKRWNPVTGRWNKHSFLELPSHHARINAIAEMNKMEGDYAPTKNEHTFPTGGLKIGYGKDDE